MTREQAIEQVAARMVHRHRVAVNRPELRAVVDEKYPAANYQMKELPQRDYVFSGADVLELEREMRRRMRV